MPVAGICHWLVVYLAPMGCLLQSRMSELPPALSQSSRTLQNSTAHRRSAAELVNKMQANLRKQQQARNMLGMHFYNIVVGTLSATCFGDVLFNSDFTTLWWVPSLLLMMRMRMRMMMMACCVHVLTRKRHLR